MRVYANNKLISKKGILGRRVSMTGLVILGLGMLASFAPSYFQKIQDSGSALAQNSFMQWLFAGGWVYFSMGSLIIGFILGQIGNYYMRRFLRPVRPDMVIARVLKSFDDRNRLYVWSSPIALVAAGPAGIFAFATRDTAGKVTLRDGKVKTPFSWRKVLFFFGDENLGRPLDEATVDAKKLADWLKENIEAEVEVQPLVVFTSDKADLTVEDTQVPVIHYKQLKSFLRNQNKNRPVNKKAVQQAIAALDTYAENSGAEIIDNKAE